MVDFGTWLHTKLFGKYVGADQFGNRYYRSSRNKLWGRERRWVMFKGMVEATKIPPEWHAWLHHIADEPLLEEAKHMRPWQKPHRPNLTGTPFSYRPAGHDSRGGRRAKATGDYEPWVPPSS